MRPPVPFPGTETHCFSTNSEPGTGRSRGFGFVTFAAEDQAQAAIQAMNDQELVRPLLSPSLPLFCSRSATLRDSEGRRCARAVPHVRVADPLDPSLARSAAVWCSSPMTRALHAR